MVGQETRAYPPSLTEDETQALSQTILDWSIAHGFAVRPAPAIIPREVDPRGITAVTAPVTLFPSPFPKTCFEQARKAQHYYHQLYAAVSCDEAFLEDTVAQIKHGDEFIQNLWDIHVKVKSEGYTQPLSFGLFRSDYMVHQDTSSSPTSLQVKQVEFNTIASSFGGLSTATSNLHKYANAFPDNPKWRPVVGSHTLDTHNYPRHLADIEYPLLKNAIPTGSLDLPENGSAPGLANGILEAYRAYPRSELGYAQCILFLIQDGERNVFDQKHLEYHINNFQPDIPVFRLTLAEVLKHTSLAKTSKRELLYHHPRNPARVFEAATVYLRAGYTPDDYPDKEAWSARLHLERSFAIKCPTVLTQLAGTKKVQQILAAPQSPSEQSVLARFIPDDTEATSVLGKTFTHIYPMDTSPAGLEARKTALDPEQAMSYVLKPQREGGGNNIYRSAIPAFLRSIPEEHWPSYILMELITPPPVQNIILRNGQIERGGVICELGIYGACLWNQNTGEIKISRDLGYLLRTKGDQSEEGGVAAGFGCMDSCHLV